MITKYKNKNLTWIDVIAPTRDEALKLMTDYNLNPLIAEEILIPTTRAKTDKYDDMLFLVLNFPKFHIGNKNSKEQEVDFIIGKKFLITVHYEVIDPLHQFSKAFEVNSILGKKELGPHAGFLFFYLIREFYHHTADQIVEVGNKLKEVEKSIFDGKETEMVKVLSHVSREFTKLRQIIHLHEHVLNSFERAGKQFFGESFSYHLSAIIGEFKKVQNILENYRGILEELKDTNDSLLSAKTGQIMKKLTALNFIMLPITVVVNIFVITHDSWLIQSSSGFFLMFLGLIVLGIIMFLYFKTSDCL